MTPKNCKKTVVLINILILFLLPPFPDESGASSLTTEQERILGQQFLAEIRKHVKILDDDFANEYINDLGQYLLRPLETKRFPFHFYIIESNTLNAFAGPGGHIFFYSGLIETMTEIDELASVVCHEISHVSARHVAQRIERNTKIGLATAGGVLAGVLIGSEGGQAVIAGSVAAGTQAQLHYSREDERQADQLGFKYTAESGFNPEAMMVVLNKIQRGQGNIAGAVPRYFLTHPTGPERMSRLETMLSGHTPKSEKAATEKFRRLFPFFKTTLTAKCSPPSEAEEMFRKALEREPDSTQAHFGLAIVLKADSEYALAIDHFQKALNGAPDSPPILRELGETYILNNQDEEGVALLEKSLSQNNEDRSALFLLAKYHEDREEYPEATRLYERLKSMEPVKDDVIYRLGVCYGRENKLALAHYHFGIYFRRMGDLEKAKYHFQEANKSSENDPAMKAKIQKAIEEISVK